MRAAVTGQSKSLAEEAATGIRHRVYRLDDTAERGPRRLFRRRPRARSRRGEASPVAYGGFATRGVALTVDAALAATIFLTGAAVVRLVGSLVWHPHWSTSHVAALLAVAGLLVDVLYFAGFWSASRPDARHAADGPARRRSLRVPTRPGTLSGASRRARPRDPARLHGFLPALVDDRRRALQDFLAGTVVLYTED